MKPFNLEAAKNGEPIEVQNLNVGSWTRVKFVGVRANGSVVYERQDGEAFGRVSWRPQDCFRMETRKCTRWLNIYRDRERGFYSCGELIFLTKDLAQRGACDGQGERTFISSVVVEWEE